MNTHTAQHAGDACAVANPLACLSLALAAVDAARIQLARYASATDAPAWQVVDAADWLDAARDALAKAVCHA